MTRNLSTFASDYEYNNITYNKGLLLFDMLRKSVGDEKFFGCLKGYFADYDGKIASAEGLVSEFMKSGVDIEGVFTSFTEGKILI